MKNKFWEKFLTRKFVAATLTALLLTGTWVASEFLPGARVQLPSLFTALVGTLGAYTAGNVVQDHVLKNKTPDAPDEPDDHSKR